MPTLLSKGYKLPLKGEKKTWWQDIKDNFTRVNNHTHDNIDSQPILFSNLTRTTQQVLAAAWVVSGEATGYKQTITLPAGLNFDTTNAICRLANGTPVYPKIVKLSTTQYEIYVNDNTIELTVVYA